MLSFLYLRVMRLLLFLFFLTFTSISWGKAKLEGTISIDGSSTVYPITMAIAEEFRSHRPRIRINIGVSGTGGGFKKFTAGETHINNASRPISKIEKKKAKANKISYMELPVALDGLTVVINKGNTWAKTMTTAELKKIWDYGSAVTTWKHVRPEWPDRRIKLYGPGPDSGTFDYFTKAINGKARRCRSDFVKSEDDNVLIKGVSGHLDALGFFGYAYYKENAKLIHAVAIDAEKGGGPVVPSHDTIFQGTYQPLSRPVFIYALTTYTAAAVSAAAVEEFITFYLRKVPLLVGDVGYVPLPTKHYEANLAKFKKALHP